ncbi:carbohydrate-binding module family 13 protein [Trichoderma asperellum CBS 433.97]|uniref:Carbohydrate-binding module family 13 protein n=1 Tax=Trichoderma asperellum (strain ATCC 204424 / CBS 433.97 / NBRC 101777) TaxID=1042311 RepID=A0A2T3ZAI8_TRIA4|nr:carbohydrate-binding module family 13 protein [Trichoderma asperellum CBS 433.97]PTB41829.1 carbohydrate-binding module family 13 protein [Trichoderma asperellum CBS 433.97]
MTLLDGIYIIVNTIPQNPVLDLGGVTGPLASPIAGVVGFTRQGGENTNQRWILTALRPGVYSLVSEFGDTWLTAPADGATLAQIESARYDPVYNETTRWKITELDNNGNCQIESVPFPGKVMDLEMASPRDGTRVILYPNNKTPNQIWKFIPLAIPLK